MFSHVFLFLIIYAHALGCIYVSTDTRGVQKSMSDFPLAGVMMVVSYLIWVLGIELQTS